MRTVSILHFRYFERKGNEDLKSRVQLCYMDMLVDSEKGDTDITFLYKLAGGACPKSHGFNAARCAGIPADVVAEAKEVAEGMEEWPEKIEAVKAIAN